MPLIKTPLIKIALIGNPNSGKTTLFNALTGKHQRIGNWPGVTVEKKQGYYQEGNLKVEVTDLPGCYSPDPLEDSAIDEQITHDFILSNQTQLFINVVDASELERHLHLTLQLIEKDLPLIVVLNRMDVLQKQKKTIDVQLLEQRLGCPVLSMSAIKKQGIKELKDKIRQFVPTEQTQKINQKIQSAVQNTIQNTIQNTVLATQKRFQLIQSLLSNHLFSLSSPHANSGWTEKIDNIILHRLFGIPLFLLFMYGVFLFSIQIGGYFQAGFDNVGRTLFVELPEQLLYRLHAPNWLLGLLAFGVGQGINTTMSFIPVIGSMFLCLSFLELSGYMSRVAFVMDKVMQWVGLPGKSFVPLIVGFGCNVPGVMATRTLENDRERILTILMSPFMSCGARLAIYALFVAAFFPHGGQNIIFGLYLIGILVALLTGFILRRTLLPGKSMPLIIELPAYQWPTFRSLLQTTWYRLKRFILKAGLVIVLLSMIIGGFNHYLMKVGQTLTPLFSPMGIQKENWPATVGLLTGVVAKEVVVGTLNSLYLQELRSNASIVHDHTTLDNISPNDAMNSSNNTSNNKSILGVMVERFGSPYSAFAYLLFVLLYFPCVSVIASIYRELNRFWAFFSVAWTTGIAYAVAVIFYQSTQLFQPALGLESQVEAIAWIIACLGAMALCLWGLRYYARTRDLSGFNLNYGIKNSCSRMKAKGNRGTLKPLPARIIIEQ